MLPQAAGPRLASAPPLRPPPPSSPPPPPPPNTRIPFPPPCPAFPAGGQATGCTTLPSCHANHPSPADPLNHHAHTSRFAIKTSFASARTPLTPRHVAIKRPWRALPFAYFRRRRAPPLSLVFTLPGVPRAGAVDTPAPLPLSSIQLSEFFFRSSLQIAAGSTSLLRILPCPPHPPPFCMQFPPPFMATRAPAPTQRAQQSGFIPTAQHALPPLIQPTSLRPTLPYYPVRCPPPVFGTQRFPVFSATHRSVSRR